MFALAFTAERHVDPAASRRPPERARFPGVSVGFDASYFSLKLVRRRVASALALRSTPGFSAGQDRARYTSSALLIGE